MMAVIYCSIFSANAQAFDSKVIIVNGTGNNCTTDHPCYNLFQVNVSQGDTVTWINQDDRTHTVTTGTTNYGSVGVFDSGLIQPGHSFTQFFGSVGTFHYYDKTDTNLSGLIVVSKEFSHAELSWVPESLKIEKENFTANSVIITKQIQNTGNTDAHSIIITLKIQNQTSLLYNSLVKLEIPSKNSVPVKFVWHNPPDGQYQLFFEANSANTAGDMNANDDRSLDLISIPTIPLNQSTPIIHQNFTIGNNANIPEFGSISFLILIISIILPVVLSAKSGLKFRLFS